MDDRGANIDIVFRNGLKDYEVLPPHEVWDNIHPVIKRRQRPFIILKIAAVSTIVISISLLTYRWSREVTTGIDNTVMTLNMQAAYPLYSTASVKPLSVVSEPNRQVEKTSITSIKGTPKISLIPEIEKSTSPETVFLNETTFLPNRRTESLSRSVMFSLNPPKKNSVEIMTTDPVYMPLTDPFKGTKRWSVSAMASPTYYSKLNVGGDAFSKQLMESEQNLTSYSGGLAFAYKINKKFSIQSGIYYSSVGQMLDGISSYSGFQPFSYSKGDHNFEVLTTGGTIYTNNADVFLISNTPVNRILTAYTTDVIDPKKAGLQYINNNLHQSLSYLELPVVMRYKLIDKMIDLNLIGGVSYNVLVSNSVYTMVGSIRYPVGETEGLNPISLSSTVGMGMEYSFSDKLSLNLEPTIRYYLNPYNQTTGSKIHPYSFGIFSGLSYKF